MYKLIGLLLLTACVPDKTNLYGTAALPGKVAGIALPENYTETIPVSSSFAHYLVQLPLKKDNQVLLYDGTAKRNQQAHYAVIDMEIGRKDLQQCADAVIRLRAEYLYANKQYAAIAFHFTNGQLCDYKHFAEGNRVKFTGNRFTWVKTAEEDYSYTTFRKYLDLVFSYAGTASLHKELVKVSSLSGILPGDVLIQTGNPYGHAVIVLRVVVDKGSGKKLFLLAQSYMPAQEIHVLKNPGNAASPWYSEEEISNTIETPEWTFTTADLRRFSNQ